MCLNDFLDSILSLNELPEQQTHIPTLCINSENEDENNTEIPIDLGFTHCCYCGSKLTVIIRCHTCLRVNYCSVSCLKKDRYHHSSIICSFLKICSQDEAVDGKKIVKQSKQNIEFSYYRIWTEHKSYPITISHCLYDFLENKLSLVKTREISVHIVASSKAELLHSNQERTHTIYNEALENIIGRFLLKSVTLRFIGNECYRNWHTEDFIFKSSCILTITTHQLYYHDFVGEAPDVLLFFNPGFTFPEYKWNKSLHTIENNTMIYVASNTKIECVMDWNYLLENKHIGETEECFVRLNLKCGKRVRQSNTMANDIFIKSRWVFHDIIRRDRKRIFTIEKGTMV